jgi:hypothetical protein
MDIELRSDIDEPQEGTTIAQFINILNRKQTNWVDRFRMQYPPRQPQGQRQ